MKIYAVYKGDEFITLGTSHECAKYIGVTPKTIRFMSSPTCHRRNVSGNKMIAIVVDEIEGVKNVRKERSIARTEAAAC